MNQLFPPGLQLGTTTAVNDLGEAVGWGFNDAGTEQGFVWDPSAGFINLNVPPAQTTLLHTINNRGQVGGQLRSTESAGPDIAVIWTSGLPAALPGLADGDSAVLSLNNFGQAVGTSAAKYNPEDANAPFAPTHAAMWKDGVVTDLTQGTPWSEAEDINNDGQVVGWRYIPNAPTTYNPFLWNATDGLIQLPYLGRGARPSAINDSGQVVGYTDGTSAALWENDMIYDLNTLIPANSGWNLQYATDINDAGAIVGYGLYNGQPEGFLLTPIDSPSGTSIPDPSAGLLLALPAAAFALSRPRRRRHRR